MPLLDACGQSTAVLGHVCFNKHSSHCLLITLKSLSKMAPGFQHLCWGRVVFNLGNSTGMLFETHNFTSSVEKVNGEYQHHQQCHSKGVTVQVVEVLGIAIA